MPVDEYCRVQHEVQREIYEAFAISFDAFGRSSSPDNHELTQAFYHSLDARGLIEERTVQQLYSVVDGRFLPDRYVIGTCPHCGYTAARGDQCESCTRVMDPTELIEPRSAISGSTDLEIRSTRHLYLRQSQLEGEIGRWIDEHDDWPVLVTSIARKWLKEGLRDRSITRDLSWGVPVDRPGFENKVFYVWFDAPIAYIATTKTLTDRDPSRGAWRSWWYDANDVTYYQFMAKDNVPFHTITFPATLIGTAEPWKLVDQLKGFNWLTFYGGKFSTSGHRGIFMDAALREFPADYWRYWLLANAPESGDAVFTFTRFAEQVNKDLAHTLGNLINRTMRFCVQHFGNEVPSGGGTTELEREMVESLARLVGEYREHLDALEFRKAVAALRSIWVLGNGYLATAAPWAAIKSDPERAAAIIRTALRLIRLCAILSWPIIPSASERVLAAFGHTGGVPPWPGDVGVALDALPPGDRFELLPPLFQVIDIDRVQELTTRYGGAAAGEEEASA
jgi:methionyl-tRNA synthetase